MASCLHDYVGFHPTAEQTAFLSQPVYTNDTDFLKGANVQNLYHFCPGLICGWAKVLATHPQNPLLFDIELSLENDRTGQPHPEMVQKMLTQIPKSSQLQIELAQQLCQKEDYESAWKTIFPLILRDDNNVFLYEFACKDLEDWRFYEEALQLAKTWTLLHPDNPEAWLRLTSVYHRYAWEARGSGWASTVTREGWKLMAERMAEAKKCFEQALKLAPKDYRVYEIGLSLGTGLGTDHQTMEGYFQKMRKLNPYDYQGYSDYLDYLEPKWSGDPVAADVFANKYYKEDPYLVYELSAGDFYDNQEVHNLAERQAQVIRMRNNIKNSPHLALFEKGMKEYFKQHPEDSLNWAYYIYWVQQIGMIDETLAYAKKVIPKNNPELKSLYPTIVINTIRDMEGVLAADGEEVILHNKPEVMKLEGTALRELVQDDPDNMNYWNRLAYYYYRHKLYSDTKKCFDHIGDEFDLSIWNKRDFNLAKKMIADQAK